VKSSLRFIQEREILHWHVPVNQNSTWKEAYD
jgi:hypothetical protein